MTARKLICLLVISFAFVPSARAAEDDAATFADDTVQITLKKQYPAVRPGAESAVAVNFKPAESWHFYADEETAPGGMNLKVKPSADGLIFAEPIFPQSTTYQDKSLGKRLQVYSGEFTVFLPFTVDESIEQSATVTITVEVSGAVCSDVRCRMPDFDPLKLALSIDPEAPMDEPAFAVPPRAPTETTQLSPQAGAKYTTLAALALALVAGLVLNVMPCVWPVIPIIIMRLLSQAKQDRTRSITLGLAFCAGILLFFVGLCVLNLILRVSFQTVFQWGDHFRNPAFLAAMSLLMVVLALFMFDVFSIGIPASLAGKAEARPGHLGSVGTGLLAAILATPCSFAILTAAFAWAQTQPLSLATAAIMLIGVGMAAPYAVLVSIPGLLQRLPKPGRWMELFKQVLGLVLLVIAVKLLEGLPESLRVSVLYYAVALAFCLWMWGTWVTYSTPAVKKWTVRAVAAGLAIATGFYFLPARKSAIDWKSYDREKIESALEADRPVLIEFTADWCFSCKTVEKLVYGRKEIARLIEQKDVLPIKADTTLRTYPAAVDLKDIYNEPAVPVTVFYPPGSDSPVKFRGVLFADKLKQRLQEVPAPSADWGQPPPGG